MAPTPQLLGGVGSLVGLQFFSRALTFALNTALARTLGPSWYAFANVQLQLISSTALFLSKEGVRRACQRIYPGGSGAPLAFGMNLAWLTLPITVIAAAAVAAVAQLQQESEGRRDMMAASDYSTCVWLICVAALIEACAEPAWVYAQANWLLSQRVLAEGAALFLKAAITAYLALEMRLGALAFGYAQLMYAVAYAALLLLLLSRKIALRVLLPRRACAAEVKATGASLAGDPTATSHHSNQRADGGSALTSSSSASYLPAAERSLALQLCVQAAQKYALTEGERLVLVSYLPLDEQGVFALVGSLGSLVARLLLAPLEEAAFAHFSRSAAREREAEARDTACGGAVAEAESSAEGGSANGASARVASASGGAAAGGLAEMLDEAHLLLRGVCLFGLLFVAFGPPYAWLLLRLLYGAAWSDHTDAPSLLGTYCLHVCAMSLNGVSEAYVGATASQRELAYLSIASVGFTAVYLLSALAGLASFGLHGLMLANVLNMALRTAGSVVVMRRQARNVTVPPRILPQPLALAVVVVAAALTRVAALWVGGQQASAAAHAVHVLIGGMCLVGVLVCALRSEPGLAAAFASLRQKRGKQE
tara:strand:+ start:586 stop:2370 length:1785 start_codon:yes stop_codon:yes gene_type:complete